MYREDFVETFIGIKSNFFGNFVALRNIPIPFISGLDPKLPNSSLLKYNTENVSSPPKTDSFFMNSSCDVFTVGSYQTTRSSYLGRRGL